MHIIALPLATPSKPVHGRLTEHLAYYHFVTPPDTTHTIPWTKRIVAKASDIWAGFVKAPEDDCKARMCLDPCTQGSLHARVLCTSPKLTLMSVMCSEDPSCTANI
ncbi:hypothetical protein TRAPUB_10666 [Trametes pubescens]|uniref:Uncharacterized protein n=1 Tax=Trametes pubescens TaxID=154538 RepID=A0A1M2VYZ0_TRAPU|nr:hypothetical protein TRAPUB_10666 [Trametes pubescens]